MKLIAVSTILAGGLFAGLLGAASTANATTMYPGPNGGDVTRVYDADTYYGPHPGSYDAGGHDAPRFIDRYDPFGLSITATGPFGRTASIGVGGANISLPIGLGEASVEFRGRG